MPAHRWFIRAACPGMSRHPQGPALPTRDENPCLGQNGTGLADVIYGAIGHDFATASLSETRNNVHCYGHRRQTQMIRPGGSHGKTGGIMTVLDKENCRILYVDDEPEVRTMVKSYLNGQGYGVTVADSGKTAMDRICHDPIDILFTDLNMPGMNGIELLKAVRAAHPQCEVIIVTGYGTVDAAVEALKLGACDFLQKPIAFGRLKALVQRVAEKKALETENRLIRRQLTERFGMAQLVGVSQQMQEIYDIIDRIRHISPTVLIQGESGTGKELAARVIHNTSDRRHKPFVAVNCGAIVGSLLESELFGHVRGAFTGALRDNAGLFKAAGGGTLFLDEVGEIHLSLQVKLLRVLQERRVRAVGSTREKPVDVRIIAATNRDSEELIKAGIMRKDLFYRLNVINIRMPALRQMRTDIPLLADHFVKKFNAMGPRRLQGVSTAAMDLLMGYDWPGNVRQLENVIERAFAMGTANVIQPEELPAEIRHSMTATGTGEKTLNLEKNETRLIRKALKKTGGNRALAARLLGINTATIYRKIEKYGITG